MLEHRVEFRLVTRMRNLATDPVLGTARARPAPVVEK